MKPLTKFTQSLFFILTVICFSSAGIFAQTPIAYGECADSTITILAEQIRYSFFAQAGDRIIIRMTNINSLESKLSLRDPGGNPIHTVVGITEARIDTLLAFDGEYIILASDDSGDELGAFGLCIQKTFNPPIAVVSSLFSSSHLSSIDQLADMDAFTFYANAGDQVLIQMSNISSLESRIELYNPEGIMIEFSTGITQARFYKSLTDSGQYTLIAMDSNGDAVSNYGISIQGLNYEYASTIIACDTAISDNLIFLASVLSYSFFVKIGDVLSIKLSNTNSIQSRLELFNPEGEFLIAQTDITQATIEYTANSEGCYIILAMDDNGDGIGQIGLNLNYIIGDCYAGDCSANREICANGIDDDGDMLIDCEDPDCAPSNIAVLATDPSTPPDFTDGRIEISANGLNLEYSIHGDTMYQAENIFKNLPAGIYEVWLQNTVSECAVPYTDNPILLRGEIPCDAPPSIFWDKSKTKVCPGSLFSPTLSNSDINFRYELFQNDLSTNQILDGMGGSFSFDALQIDEATTFTISAILFSDASCIFDLQNELVLSIGDLAFDISTTDETVFNNDGRIDLCIEGGIPPYTLSYLPSRGMVEEVLGNCSANFEWSMLRAGFYMLEVHDSFSCRGDTLVKVGNSDKRRIGFPEKPLLTPNGDGKNDLLIYEGLFQYPDDNELIIYNRFGSVVFRQNGYTNDWDASIDGQPAPDGTYFYSLSLFHEGQIIESYAGFITVVR